VKELIRFSAINKIEGYSYIVLIFFAMPLKYIFGYPIATKIFGGIHGILFIAFVYQLIIAAKSVPFTKKESFLYFLLSLIPFGSFYTEKLLKDRAAAETLSIRES